MQHSAQQPAEMRFPLNTWVAAFQPNESFSVGFSFHPMNAAAIILDESFSIPTTKRTKDTKIGQRIMKRVKLQATFFSSFVLFVSFVVVYSVKLPYVRHCTS